MPIPRKQSQETPGIQEFIQGAGQQTLLANPARTDSKRGHSIVTVSLMGHEAEWIDRTLDAMRSKTARRITRTELISAALDFIREKTPNEILQILRNR